MGVKPDYSKLSPDLQEKIKGWEANNPANKQLVKLNDIASILQDVSNVIDYRGKQSDETLKQLGTVLTDAREQLVAMNAKEAPEAPDTSKPVIGAISKLEKALTSAVSAQKAPIVNVPKADAPVVNVDAPNVTVDTTEIAKLLKTDIPQAFDTAIKSIVIPKNDTSNLANLLKDLSEKLDSIDTGVRLKPQAPSTIGINNDVTTVDKPYATRLDDQTPILYIGKAPVGSATSAAVWQIAKLDTSSGLTKTWAGSAGFTQVWDDRASLTFN